MADPQPTATDEALGLSALSALLDGDLGRATEALVATHRGYRLAFLCRLALLVPSVTLRLAWRIALRS